MRQQQSKTSRTGKRAMQASSLLTPRPHFVGACRLQETFQRSFIVIPFLHVWQVVFLPTPQFPVKIYVNSGICEFPRKIVASRYPPCMMRFGTLVLLVILAGCSTERMDSPDKAISHATTLRERGDFNGAAAMLGDALKAPDLSAAQRKALECQIDVLGRIKQDYSLTKDDLFKKLSNSVKDLTPAEFGQWIAEGRFDSKTIEGRTRFVGSSVSNLFFRYPELTSRRLDKKDDVTEQKSRLEICRAIKRASHNQQTPYVLPHHFVCTMTVTAEKDAAPAGEVIRAWLPIPRQYPFQDQFNLISSSSPVKVLAPETSPIRSAYLEQSASKDGSSKFAITYSYTRSGVCFDMDPGKIRPADMQDPILKKFTGEAPHVVFTGKIKELADEIAGAETNPLREARDFYDWIGGNIKYSFAREYSTLTNISDYCLSNGYGDCGQETLLFITLCRSRGIPARWQTGWDIFPGAKDIHDWSEIYLAPYGWVPVDTWAGLFATRYDTALTPAERSELHDFYFGGLDYYRMAANSDHSQKLDPPKQSLRSDDVDFQRGELETGRHNIYFDKYSYSLSVKELE
jgi:transglutaminase-like putative cysteine protease